MSEESALYVPQLNHPAPARVGSANVTRGNGAPGALTPLTDFYIDETTGDLYFNQDLTASGWTLSVAAGGGITSVFGRTTAAITAQAGDYTSNLVTESGNLYYTDARSRAAVSATGLISYSSSTGVFSLSTITIAAGGTGATSETAAIVAMHGVRNENSNSGTNDDGTPPTFAGGYTGQLAVTNYNRLWWFDSANWRSALVLSGRLEFDGKSAIGGVGSEVIFSVNTGSATPATPADNVLRLMNRHNAHYSAVAFNDLNNSETSALGYGNPGSVNTFAGRAYWESFGGAFDLAIVIAVSNGVTFKWAATTGDFVGYASTAGAGGQGAEKFRVVRSSGDIQTAGKIILGDDSYSGTTQGEIQGFDANASIILREGGQNRTSYYVYGDTLANAIGGHKFYTGGVKASQTLKLQVANDGIKTTNVPLIAAANFRIESPTVPGTAAATGTTGTIAWDSGFIYVCTASNTWKRAAIATW